MRAYFQAERVLSSRIYKSNKVRRREPQLHKRNRWKSSFNRTMSHHSIPLSEPASVQGYHLQSINKRHCGDSKVWRRSKAVISPKYLRQRLYLNLRTHSLSTRNLRNKEPSHPRRRSRKKRRNRKSSWVTSTNQKLVHSRENTAAQTKIRAGEWTWSNRESCSQKLRSNENLDRSLSCLCKKFRYRRL